MADTYEPGATVTVSLPEGDVEAVVVVDTGGDTVIVRYPHPHLERETTNIPIARALLGPATPAAPPAPDPGPDQSVT